MVRYCKIREMALRAEAAGFDSVWVYDHLVYRFPNKPTRGIWEAWTLLTALAEATSRVEVGVLVLCVPFRNPALLAKMADTLEEISGGRLILGLGAGWHEPEFTAFGYPFDHLVDRFEEAVQIIRPLAKTGEVDFRGSYYQAPDCVSRPRGPRADGPPILIASFRPRMLRLTAQYADAWNTAWLGWPTKLAARRAELEAACAEVGRDPKTLEVTVGVSVAFPDLGEGTEDAGDRDKHLSGGAAEIAAGFRAYEAEGVGHIILASEPNTLPALDRLAEALRHYRRG
jgi:alkanesulfonate monooxygenase SsuD/methylene tetrahydromethanopterin reductase-like flavin-dependent oxidoreductase (luciferase family)